jgi:acyl-CoA reductase-like NAD-dependent aldehyde dehydrogenase
MSRLDSDVKVRNPRTGEIDRDLAAPTSEELTALVAKLRGAQKNWEAIGAIKRGEILMQWHAELVKESDAIVQALYEDTGRITESKLELQVTLAGIERWAKMAPALMDESESQKAQLPGVTIHPSFRPYQLVGVISPWNFPLLLGCIDAIPALAAGCAVIIKPSEVTPRFLAPLARSIERVPVLRDLFGTVEGAAEVGQALIPQVDFVCFTGSTEVG